jgi:hypothetical protein
MIPAYLLVILAVAYRLATGLMIHSGASWLSNFAPLAALALCSGACFPMRFKFALPLGALLISDLVLNSYYSAPLFSGLILCRYLTLAGIGLLGMALQNRVNFKTMLPAAIVSSILFYVVTCTFAWLSDPGYASTLGALVQSLTVGLPQYSATPSWMFFRNSLLSDLTFTVIFIACLHFSRSVEPSRSKAAFHPA